MKPLKSSSVKLFTEFWEALFECKFNLSMPSTGNQRECTGNEDVTGVQNTFTDMSLMPIFYNIYKGVYAVAHALHNILSCNKTCDNRVSQLDPFTVSVIVLFFNHINQKYSVNIEKYIAAVCLSSCCDNRLEYLSAHGLH